LDAQNISNQREVLENKCVRIYLIMSKYILLNIFNFRIKYFRCKI